jgi:hypothetical protein
MAPDRSAWSGWFGLYESYHAPLVEPDTGLSRDEIVTVGDAAARDERPFPHLSRTVSPSGTANLTGEIAIALADLVERHPVARAYRLLLAAPLALEIRQVPCDDAD